MSTSVLYQALGLGGYTHQAAWDGNGVFKLRVHPPVKSIKCPGCGSEDVIRRGTYDRKVHAPPIGMRKTIVFIKAPHVECRKYLTIAMEHFHVCVPANNDFRRTRAAGHEALP